MRIYISGPMRSQPDMNQPAFAAAATMLRDRDHEVYVPTEQPGALEAKEGDAVREALADNLSWVCRYADAVVVLPGWRDSRGTKAEVTAALALEIPVWPVAEFLAAGEQAPQVRRVTLGVFVG